jgi:hypothetical protein
VIQQKPWTGDVQQPLQGDSKLYLLRNLHPSILFRCSAANGVSGNFRSLPTLAQWVFLGK